MKKLLSLFCLFTLLTAFTCENESLDSDISFDNENTDLIGIWNLEEFNTELNTTTDFSGQVFNSDITIEATDTNYTIEFMETSFSASGSYTYNTNVNVDGVEVLSDMFTLENVTGTGNYSTNGNEMTVDGSFFEFEFEGDLDTSALEGEQTGAFQISDDGQTLTFTQNETTTETDDATGFVVTINNNSTSVWTRL